MDDRPENVSRASLQRHGEYVLGIARHFGNLDLRPDPAPTPDLIDDKTEGGIRTL